MARMIKKAIGAALLTWVTRSLVGGMKRRTARRRATADAQHASGTPNDPITNSAL